MIGFPQLKNIMKPSEIYAVFTSIGENANLGSGPIIVEVYEDKAAAKALAGNIRVEVAKKWGWEGKELNESDKDLLNGTVEVLTLEDAIEKIKDDIHENYASMDPGF